MDNKPRLVYIEYGTEHALDGALLMGYPEDKPLGRTRDSELISASLANDDTDGIVYAYVGADLNWHFDHHPTREERQKEGL